MSYRPQFLYTPTPEGFVDEEFEYYFDSTNTQGLSAPLPGQLTGKLTLQFQQDAEFVWRGTQISGDTGPLCIRFYDPQGYELAAVTVENGLAYTGYLQGANPIGRLPVPFEPEIIVPKGGYLQVDLYTLAS